MFKQDYLVTASTQNVHYFPGYVLNFCCAFIVAVMLRNLITLARTNGLASILPLDEHIYFHKMAGWFIFIYSALHTIAHFINFGKTTVEVCFRWV